MTSRKAWTAGLVALAVWSPALRAQVPGMPPIGAAGGASAAGCGFGSGGGWAAVWAAPRRPPSRQRSGASSVCPAATCKLARPNFAPASLGQMANSMVTGPLGAVTGGFLPTLCPPPTAAQAAALANQPGAGAQAAAAKIQAE